MYRRTIYLLTSLLTLCLCTGVTVADLQEGLVSHWKMDEGAGNIAYDSAGTSDGQLMGIANWKEGYLNEGVEFREGYQNGTGSVGFIACKTGPEYERITNAITVSCWVLPHPEANGQANWVFMIFRSGARNESFHLAYRINNNDIRFRTTLLDANSQFNNGHFGAGAGALFDGGWHHVAGTYDGQTKIIYLDGEEIGSTEIVGTFEKGAGRVLMNCTRDIETPNCGAEVLDDMRIYDRALSAEEVAELAGAVQVFSGKATNPTPIDRSTFEGTSVHLAWWYARRAEEDWAISEIVYLDTDRDAVANGDVSVKIGESEVSGDLSELDVQDLIPGSTYYWRVDEVYADGQVIAGYIWQFSIVSKKATAPQPADGTLYADPNIVLSWTAGLGATSHAVHIDTDQAAVANAATADGVTVTEPNYSPDPLAADTTYYWRVDEIGAGGTFVGDVWSLTVGPDIPVTDPNLVGYWKLDETPDDHIIDASGHHHHGLLVGGPTLVDDVAGGKALEFNGQNQFCKLGNWLPSQNQLTVALRVKWAGSTGASQGLIAKRNTWTNSMWTLWAQENGQIAFETFKNTLLSETMAVDTWEHWAVTHDNGQTLIYRDGLQVASGAQPSFGNQPTANLVLGAMEFIGDTGRNPFNGALDDVRLYNKVLTAAEIQQLSRIDLLQAWDPTPASGSASNLVLGQNTVLLSWQPGDKAAQHKVLFGSEPNALAELGTVTETSIASPVVDVNSTYFWKVDEINTDGTVTEGAVWSFTTTNFLIIDDMEAYNDLDPTDPNSNRIFNAWIDGLTDPSKGGSIVGYENPPFAEQTIVHSGNQSMPMFYDNSAAAKSEATLTLTSNRNWTVNGVDTLTIWFRGESANTAEQMYVTLNGSARVDNDNPDAATTTSWTPWNIPLQAFADQGVNLTNVNSITLGLSSVTGGTGTMYFDDIRLHPPTQ